jgi:GNAT superfamily N-acetyltransferase
MSRVIGACPHPPAANSILYSLFSILHSPSSLSVIPMPHHVRPATRSDAEDAIMLWRMLQDEHEAAEPRLRRSLSAEERWRNDFRMWVRSPVHGIFVAESDDRVVGLATGHPYWPAPVYEQRLEIYINEVIVRPGFRGRGIGRALIEAVLAWARDQGAAQVRAGVLTCNPDALEFWRRIGGSELYTTVTIGVESGEL